MKEIKVKIVDFWGGFNSKDNFILEALRRNYSVTMVEENPEYLFYSCFGHSHHKFTSHDCVKIYYTGENQMGNFNECDYAIGFDHMEFGDRSMRFPLYEMGRDIHALITRPDVYAEDVAAKAEFCNFIYSNGHANPRRDQIFDSISKYKTVHSAGKHRPNVPSVDLAVNGQGQKISKQQFQSRYKFSIAAENSSHPGYTTEKLIDAFSARTVPIYWGDPLVSKDINPKAFINALNFPTLKNLAAEVVRIDQDKAAYLEMLNAPVFTETYLAATPKRLQLNAFLDAIISQPIETARRRPKYGRVRITEHRNKRFKYRLKRALGINR